MDIYVVNKAGLAVNVAPMSPKLLITYQYRDYNNACLSKFAVKLLGVFSVTRFDYTGA